MSGSVELGIRELDYAAARELAKFQGEQLFFMSELPRMAERAAQELLKLDSDVLRIDTLFAQFHAGMLEAQTILALGESVVEILNLEGLSCLNQVSAQVLSEYRGCQLLVYPESLDTQTASCLALAEPDLLCVSVKRMDVGVARVLSRSRARDDLQIVVQEGIDAAVASELAEYRGGRLWIGWDPEGQPDATTARALAGVAGTLRLEIQSIDPELARALATHTGVLDLDCLESLDVASAQELAKAQCSALILDGLSRRSKKIWKAATAEEQQ